MSSFRVNLLLLFFIVILALPALAKDCPVYINSQNLDEFKIEVAGIDAQLQKCAPKVPFGTVKNGNVVIFAGDNKFTLKVENRLATRIFTGEKEATYELIMSEAQFNEILASSDRLLKFADYYKKGEAKIEAKTVWAKTKLFLAKPFLWWMF